MSRWATVEAACALLRSAPQAIPDAEALDWDDLVAFASAQLVTPAMFRCIGALPNAPADLVDYFARVHAANAARNATLLRKASALAVQFRKRGLQAVFLKGIASLVAGTYADPAERLIGDIDVLVPAFDVPAAVRVAQASGFHRRSGVRRAWSGAPSHHAPILVDGDGLGLEIHRALGTRRCARMLPAPAVLARAETVTVDGVAIEIPSLADRVTHNVLHAQVQSPATGPGRIRLRQLREFCLLAQSRDGTADWAAIETRFARNGAVEALRRQASLGQALFKVTVPLAGLDAAGAVATLRAALEGGHPSRFVAARRFAAALEASARALAENPHFAANLLHPLWWLDRIGRIRGQDRQR